MPAWVHNNGRSLGEYPTKVAIKLAETLYAKGQIHVSVVCSVTGKGLFPVRYVKYGT